MSVRGQGGYEYIGGGMEVLEQAATCREVAPGKGACWSSTIVANVEVTRQWIKHDINNTGGQLRLEERLGFAGAMIMDSWDQSPPTNLVR
jgi:hypothetical protein